MFSQTIIASSILIFFGCVSAGFAETHDIGDDRTASVGTIPHSVSVDQAGGLNLSLPVAVPRGPNGHNPSLSITYNQNVGNGILGVGFTLGPISAINRCWEDSRNHRRPRPAVWDGFQGNERFCLDGARLYEVAQPTSPFADHDGENWTVAFPPLELDLEYIRLGFADSNIMPGQVTEYRLRPDRSLRILRIAEGNEFTRDDRWLVEHPSGERFLFLSNPEHDGVWLQRAAFDAHGNRIDYAYSAPPTQMWDGSEDQTDNPGGRPRLEEIRYGSAGGETRVSFLYSENRSDPTRGWRHGLGMSITSLLSQIRVTTGDTFVRAYNFDYETSPSTKRSRLTAIRHCHGVPLSEDDPALQGPVCMPDTVFQYTDRDGLFVIPDSLSDLDVDDLPAPSDILGSGATVVGDFDGDGRDDMAIFSGDPTDEGETLRLNIAFSDIAASDGFGPAIETVTPLPLMEATEDRAPLISSCDMDGNGRRDIVVQSDPGRVMLLGGHGLPQGATSFLWNSEGVLEADEDEEVSFLACADFDGDGFDDVVTCEGPEDGPLFYVSYRITQTGVDRERTNLLCRSTEKIITDATGDGVLDLVDSGFRYSCDAVNANPGCSPGQCGGACPQPGDSFNNQAMSCLAFNLPCPCAYDVTDGESFHTCTDDAANVTAICPIGEFSIPTASQGPLPTTQPTAPTGCNPLTEGCNPISTIDEDGVIPWCGWVTPRPNDSGIVLTTGGIIGGSYQFEPSDLPPSQEFAQNSGTSNFRRSLLGTPDLNGDGNSDLLYWFWRPASASDEGESRLEVAYRRGGGEDEDRISAALEINGFSTINAQSFGLGDFDRDGRDDILFANDMTGTLRVVSHLPISASETIPEPSVNTRIPFRGRPNVGDFDGDGLADVMMCEGCRENDTPTGRWRLYRGKGAELPDVSEPDPEAEQSGLPDLLSYVRDGYGEERVFHYSPYHSGAEAGICKDPFFCTCRAETRCDPIRRPVVTKMEVLNGPIFRYAYQGEVSDRLTGQSLGPAVMEVTQLRGGNNGPWVTRSEFDNARFDPGLNAFPFAGRPHTITHWRGSGPNTPTHIYTRTKIDYHTERTAVLRPSRFSDAMTASGGTQTYFVYADEFTTRVLERDEAEDDLNTLDAGFIQAVMERSISERRDDFGNVTSIITQSEVGGAPDLSRRHTWTATYSPNIARWALRRPSTVSVQATAETDEAPVGHVTRFVHDDDPVTGIFPTEVIYREGDPLFERRVLIERDGGGVGKITALTSVDTQAQSEETQGRRAEYFWDACGGAFPSMSINPAGHTRSMTWHCGFGTMLELGGEHTARTNFVLDRFGREIERTVRFGDFAAVPSARTETIYERVSGGPTDTASPLLVRTRVEGGAHSYVETDVFGRTVEAGQLVDGRFATTTVTYDRLGRAIATSGPDFTATPTDERRGTASVFDNRDRIVRHTDRTDHVTRYAYDGLNTTITLPTGRQRSLRRDDIGRVVASTIGEGDDLSSVCRDFGALGQLLRVTLACHSDDPVQLREYLWDAGGVFVLELRDAARGRVQFAPNGFGEIETILDAAGVETRLAYDALGELLSRSRSFEKDGVIQQEDAVWEYIGLDQPELGPPGMLHSETLTKDGEVFSRETSTYDPLGRVAEVTLEVQGLAPSSSAFAYDSFGRVATLRHSSEDGLPDVEVMMAYDGTGATGAMVDTLSGRVLWQRDALNAAGQVVGDRLGNGVFRQFDYDPEYRLRGLRTADEELPPDFDTPLDDGLLTHHTYQFNPDDHLERQIDHVAGFQETFLYDTANQLSEATVMSLSGGGQFSVGYRYDDFNNLALAGEEVYAATPSGLVDQVGDRAYLRNATGHVTRIESAGGPIGGIAANPAPPSLPIDIQRQGAHKISRIETPSNALDIEHDARDRRVLSTWQNDGLRWFDHGIYRREMPPTGAFLHRYHIALPAGGTAVLSRQRVSGGEAAAPSAVLPFQDDWTYISAVDLRGSALALTDQNGALSERRAYNVMGAPRNPNDWFEGLQPLGTDAIDIGFTGQSATSLGGLVDFGGRFLDTVSGTMISPDPMIANLLDPRAYSATRFGPDPLLFDPSGYVAHDGVDRGEGGSSGAGFASLLFSLFHAIDRGLQMAENADGGGGSGKPRLDLDSSNAPKPQMSLAGAVNQVQSAINENSGGIMSCELRYVASACKFALPDLEAPDNLVLDALNHSLPDFTGMGLSFTDYGNMLIDDVELVLNSNYNGRRAVESMIDAAGHVSDGNFAAAAETYADAQTSGAKSALGVFSAVSPALGSATGAPKRGLKVFWLYNEEKVKGKIVGVWRMTTIVKTSEGPYLFYLRTGYGNKGAVQAGAQPGEWAPVRSFYYDGDFMKRGDQADRLIPLGKNDPLFRWGTEEFRQISKWLKQQPITEEVIVGDKWMEFWGWLEKHGATHPYPR